jgi:hypothetical protein
VTVQCRMTKIVGTRISLRVYWGGRIEDGETDECPNCLGKGGKGYHNAHTYLYDTPEINAYKAGGEISDHPDDRWPTKCEHCPALVPPTAKRSVFHQRLWETPTGFLEPGYMFYETWMHEDRDGNPRPCIYWDNCPGRHLIVILPNGDQWDSDCRASNCDRKDDRTHRCWVKSGEPPVVTAGKGGDTCGAGGGSIWSGSFHGFLRNGILSDA